MNWSLRAPTPGDMVRVKSGLIYHYGVFVSEAEIIQFGLAPICRPNVRDCEVEVCASDVEAFLHGGFLEVGDPDQKELGKRRDSWQIVSTARSRLGEKGYSIIHNNCEHFAYECVFGEKYSSQTAYVRGLFLAFPVLDVYVAKIPQNTELSPLYPPIRQQEIDACGSEKVKREKHYAWKLLEYGLDRTFGKKMKKLEFTKADNGKWSCDGCEFSLSHSHNAVAVAISRKRVGLDVELITPPKVQGVAEKILNEQEYADYLSSDNQAEFLLEKWTQKESIFKRSDERAYFPKKTDAAAEKTLSRRVEVGGEAYFLSVASEDIQKFRLHENIDLTKL
ncbi:MAG: lecithin retinol acyltransferase family protein [Clostridia bacterium]|nr:lecithin retinol acyltransferase family protein [Clostridia bacterium]